MIRRLKVNNPLLTSYPYHANLHSILSIVENYLPWLYSNYIQIMSFERNGKPWFEHFLVDMPSHQNYIPWFKENIMKIRGEGFSLFNKNITDFIMDSINAGYYVNVVLDDFYISKHPFYNNRHDVHDYLIWGYDSDLKVFDIGATLKDFAYFFTKINFCEIEKAFYNPIIEPRIEIMLVKVSNQFNEFNFNMKPILFLFDEYLNSYNSLLKNVEFETANNLGIPKYFGVQVYKYLIKYVGENNSNLDIRMPFLLWEHKRIMSQRIEFFESISIIDKQNDLVSIYRDDIERKHTIILNLFIKFNITKKEDIRQKIISLLKELPERETEILERVVLQAEKNN